MMKLLFGILSGLLILALVGLLALRFQRPVVGIVCKVGGVFAVVIILGVFLLKIIGPEMVLASIHHERLPQGNRLVVTVDKYYYNRQDPDLNLVRYSTTNVTAIDTKSGDTSGTLRLKGSAQVVAHTPGTLWAWETSSLRLSEFDFSSLGLRRHYDRLAAPRPGFSVAAEDGALMFTNVQGERVKLDPSNGQTRPAGKLTGAHVQPKWQDSLVSSLPWLEGRITITPSTHEAEFQTGNQRLPLGKFIEGRFVASLGESAPSGSIQPDSADDSVFIVHRDSLLNEAALQVTRIRLPMGERLWTTTLSEDQHGEAAFLEPQAVVLVTTDHNNRIFAASVRSSDGVLGWRTGL